nr:JmjC domain-containing protein [Tanacetum cinerariifolium]GFB06888.1 JmjC domain-containing protein [Tanacetum cinerariifolium]
MVVSDSNQEEGGTQDVDLDALLALANVAVTVDSNISSGGAFENPAASIRIPADVPTSANVPTGSTSVPADVPNRVAPAGVSNKGKALMVEEDIQVKERTFKQMQEDILAMYYTEADWINIMAQVEANASLSKTLLGDDVSKENFLARMAALIKKKKQALAKKLATERKDRPMTQGQQRTYMRQFVKNQSYAVYSTGWTPIPSVPEVPQSPVVSSPHSSSIRRKSLGRNRFFYEDSEDEAPHLWSALVGWEVLFESHEGEVVYMFADVSYPLSVKLMERMLRHKLEIDKDVVGNDMTTAKQLIRFIKN